MNSAALHRPPDLHASFPSRGSQTRPLRTTVWPRCAPEASNNLTSRVWARAHGLGTDLDCSPSCSDQSLELRGLHRRGRVHACSSPLLATLPDMSHGVYRPAWSRGSESCTSRRMIRACSMSSNGNGFETFPEKKQGWLPIIFSLFKTLLAWLWSTGEVLPQINRPPFKEAISKLGLILAACLFMIILVTTIDTSLMFLYIKGSQRMG